jgi:hypothetical protein
MRTLFVLAIYFGSIYPVPAQMQKRYVVKAGEAPLEVLPVEAKYVFPDFKKGTALMRDGRSSSQQFNYNFVLDEIQFLSTKGETLAIAEPVTLRNVVIDTITFYYDKTYLQEIFAAGSFKLAGKPMLVKTSEKKIGGYEMPLSSGAVITYGTVGGNSSNYYRLSLNKDVYFEKVVHYYLGDAFNHFVRADKKGFREVFPLKRGVAKIPTGESHRLYFIKRP